MINSRVLVLVPLVLLACSTRPEKPLDPQCEDLCDALDTCNVPVLSADTCLCVEEGHTYRFDRYSGLQLPSRLDQVGRE